MAAQQQRGGAEAQLHAMFILLLKTLVLQRGGDVKLDTESVLKAQFGFDLEMTGGRGRPIRLRLVQGKDGKDTALILPQNDNPLV